ncbi:MAG: zinc-ribbon domain-containing protein [Eubacterium sp.]|nr:zinc-ribbon domain-containing protein [Eubacterium sp.]
MFCINCGKQIEENAAFCSGCGTPVSGTGSSATQNTNGNVNAGGSTMQQEPVHETPRMRYFKESLGNKEMVSGIIWVCVGGVQIIISIFVFWYLIFVGIWNIVIGIMRINQKSQLRNKSGEIIYNDYSGRLASIIVCLVANLLFGGIIGVAGAIYDLVVRNYVMENVNLLRNER